MPVEERDRANLAGDVVEALSVIDTETLKTIARETGFGERTLWRYRGGAFIPQARLEPLARALGLFAKSRDDAADANG